jgi:hypothetical protein
MEEAGLMPTFTVPIHESNDCHTPAGSPAGGQFCAGAGRGDVTLARPHGFLMGLDSMRVSTEAVSQLLERDGREFTAQALPPGVPRGTKQECYSNATRLVMDARRTGEALRYAEGILYLNGDRSIGVLHGWAVTPDGRVIDNTVDHPEQHRYFGMVHDTEPYMAFMLRSKTFGVLGGKDTHSAKWLKKQGIEPMQMDPRFKILIKRQQEEEARRAQAATA